MELINDGDDLSVRETKLIANSFIFRSDGHN